ncbi:MAG: selenocysteine-specific translation elongation factor [Longimicrobiales bacterium]
MARAVVGTAGHIDHGKTALVHALTGVDTDRLPEEKARGITIDLGFAELVAPDGARLGVVDVPGHEDFVRTMVAGATGIDVVLLVVAADEGVMPQTREHLDIVQLLAVPRMVVALTKADLVDDEWLALVSEEVRDALAGTPYAAAPIASTSCRLGTGLAELRAHLFEAAAQAGARAEGDLARLPVDRSFTVQGIGTVVTGTLWSGALAAGDRARILPGSGEGRIRSVQVHGRDVPTARAGERTALALAGLDRGGAERGSVVVTDPSWATSSMITVRLHLLRTAPKSVEAGERVRALLGTAEVMARCAFLEGRQPLQPGAGAWVQLRLEAPVLARNGDRVVLRSYSPVLTLGGGVVAEPVAPKRRRLDEGEARALEALVAGDPFQRVLGALALGGWQGVPGASLPQASGLPPAAVSGALALLEAEGGLVSRGTALAPGVVDQARARIVEALDRGHASDPLRPSVPLERLREALPAWASAALAEGVMPALARTGALELAEGGARRPGFRAVPTADQVIASRALRDTFEAAGLAAPFLEDLPEALRSRPDLPALLRLLEADGRLRSLGGGLMVSTAALEAAARAITETLAGRSGLGPADFREALPVSRRHLLPILAHFDGIGVTLRRGTLRDVPSRT